MRLGVVGDIHWDVDPQAPPQSWHNRYEPESLARRLAAALAFFAESEVELVVLLGDLSDRGDEASLEVALASAAAAGAPVAAVAGNHDGEAGAVERAASRAGVKLLHRSAITLDGTRLVGVGCTVAETGRPRYRAVAPSVAPSDRVLVITSHHPLLSEAARLADAGLPYPGDLVDREAVAAQAASAAEACIVLCGHIHARCAQARGRLLQLSLGALIEPPFDCAVVEVATHARPSVARRSLRLGPEAAFEPVFAPDEERWAWTGTAWHPA
jgi:predicted phosphodiesterase